MTVLILEAALRGLLVAAGVGAGLTALRVKHVPVRKAAWTLVLLAASAMPWLMRWPALAGLPRSIAWIAPIHSLIPSSLPATAPQPAEAVSAMRAAAPSGILLHSSAVSVSAPESAAPNITLPIALPAPKPSNPSAAKQFSWPPLAAVLAWTYLAVAGVLLLRLLIGLFAALRLWSTAERVSPLLAPVGSVRASSRITSPVTIGSGVVLPAGFEQWDSRRLRIVLAHELSHVRQMDFYLQFLAGIYTALFWFSPLGWWLRGKLSSLGEAIGDRAGLAAAASSSDYAQVVLEFAALPQRRLPGVAMARSANVSRRIEGLLSEGWFRSAFAEGRRRAVASLLLVPAALFAATALVRVPAAAAQTTQPPSAPAALPSPAKPDPAQPQESPSSRTGQAFAGQGPDSGQGMDVAPAPPPVPQRPLTSPETPPALPVVAPPAPPLSSAGIGLGRGQSASKTGIAETPGHPGGHVYFFSSNGDSWAIVSGSGADIQSPRFGAGHDAAEFNKARQMAHGPFLWFTHGGKSWVVTNPAIVRPLESQLQAIRSLGARQRLVGQTQQNLAVRQQAMARLQREAAQADIPDMQQLMPQIEASLQSARKELQTQLAPEKMAVLQKELKSELSRQQLDSIQSEMKNAEKEMTPLKMDELQAKLKSELGPARMAEIQARMKAAQMQWNAKSLAELEARLAWAQARIARAQAEMGARQGAFGAKMGKLGAQMGQLGEEEGRLGRQQGTLSRNLNEQVRRAIRQSLGNGQAVQVK